MNPNVKAGLLTGVVMVFLLAVYYLNTFEHAVLFGLAFVIALLVRLDIEVAR